MLDTKKKLLILGASSFLGYSFNKIANLYFEITTHSNKYSGKFDVNYDLSKKENLKEIIKLYKPDIIINFIALTDVNLCQTNRNLAYSLNVELVENILDIISGKDINFYHISSDSVYDNSNGFSYENDTNPKNYYAETKYKADLLVSKNNYTSFRVNFIDFNTDKKNSFTDAVIRIINKEVYYGIDNIFFNPLTANQLSIILVKFLKMNINPGIINIGSSKSCSKYDLLKIFFENFDKRYCKYLKKKPIEYFYSENNFITRSKNMTMNLQKMRENGIEDVCLFDDFPNIIAKVNSYIDKKFPY